ncbi:MAG: tryptophan 7-halogenase [Acidobacteriota bacterium]|nr:tryptophan 7-halogenase [Acidobacteriota bacterium]
MIGLRQPAPLSNLSVSKPSYYDVSIIGGGPAGSAAARLLASWGHSVIVLDRTHSTMSLGESLPPSCRKLFDVLGVTASIDDAKFYRSAGNTVWWEDREPRSEIFVDGLKGHQVLRRDFDRLLLSCAETAGASVLRQTNVKQVNFGRSSERRSTSDLISWPISDDHKANVQIEYNDETGHRHILTSRFTLDCSGRAGVIAKQGFRTHQDSPDTLALVGVWQHDTKWPLEEPSHTLVEAFESGWAWSVPVSDSIRYFTVMLDPKLTRVARDSSAESVYQRELRKTEHCSNLTAAATLQQRPWGCDASLYTARRFAGSNFLLVGDAASFIDPLSSFGVKKALASGWMAAIVAHTALTQPKMHKAAFELFDSREREVYTSYVSQSASYFKNALTQAQHPFWTGRANSFDDLAVVNSGYPDVEQLRRDKNVLSAFEALKQSSAIALRPTSAFRLTRRAVINGRNVVFEDQVILGEGSEDVQATCFLRGVNLVRLVEMASSHRQVPDLYEAYNRECVPVNLPDFLGALSVLLAFGILENAECQI